MITKYAISHFIFIIFCQKSSPKLTRLGWKITKGRIPSLLEDLQRITVDSSNLVRDNMAKLLAIPSASDSSFNAQQVRTQLYDMAIETRPLIEHNSKQIIDLIKELYRIYASCNAPLADDLSSLDWIEQLAPLPPDWVDAAKNLSKLLIDHMTRHMDKAWKLSDELRSAVRAFSGKNEINWNKKT